MMVACVIHILTIEIWQVVVERDTYFAKCFVEDIAGNEEVEIQESPVQDESPLEVQPEFNDDHSFVPIDLDGA